MQLELENKAMNLIILKNENFIDEKHVHIEGRQLKHMLEVQNVNVGDQMKVGLLDGKIGIGRVESIEKDRLKMQVDLNENPPEKMPLKLILAMPRPKALKRILQDCATLGVSEIYIIKTWRVDKSYWSAPILEEANMEEELILGLEQGKDTLLPKVRIVKQFKPFVEDELPGIIQGTRALVAHPRNAQECPRNLQEPVTLAIGPEGGFIDYEIDKLETIGFEAVSFSRRIMRVETAVAYMMGRLF